MAKYLNATERRQARVRRAVKKAGGKMARLLDKGPRLTAIGSMVGRAARQAPVGSNLQTDLHEVRAIAQSTLDKVRGLSQTLHPSALEQAGLASTIDWFLSTVQRQTGVTALHVTHSRAEARALADRLFVFAESAVRESPPESLRDEPTSTDE